MSYWGNHPYWTRLSGIERAAAMALLEADRRDPESAKNALGAMINRAHREKKDLGEHVSGRIYQPTIEPAQFARLRSVLGTPEHKRLMELAERRMSGAEPDWVQGATHFLAPESQMLRLSAGVRANPRGQGYVGNSSKYYSWPQWTQYDPAFGYKNVVMRDKSHAFVAPEGRYSADYGSAPGAVAEAPRSNGWQWPVTRGSMAFPEPGVVASADPRPELPPMALGRPPSAGGNERPVAPPVLVERPVARPSVSEFDARSFFDSLDRSSYKSGGTVAMPLIKSGSKQAVSANIKAELKAGKPRDQAIAIALSTARRYGKGKAYGGPVGYADGGGTDPFDAEPKRPDLSGVPFFGRQGFRSGLGKLLEETKSNATFPAEMSGAPATLRAIEAYQAGKPGDAAMEMAPFAIPALRAVPKGVAVPAIAGLAGSVIGTDTPVEADTSPQARRNAEIKALQAEIAANQQAAVKAQAEIGASKFRGVGEEAGMARQRAMDNAAKPFADNIGRAQLRIEELRRQNDEDANALVRAERNADAVRREVLSERQPFNKTPVGEQWNKVGPIAPFIAGASAAMLGRLGHGPKAGIKWPLIEGTAGGALAANVPTGWDAFFSPSENPEATAFRKYGQELKIANHPRAQEWLEYADKLPQLNPVRTQAQEEFWDPKNYGLGLGKRMVFGAGEGLLGAGMGLATAIGAERLGKTAWDWFKRPYEGRPGGPTLDLTPEPSRAVAGPTGSQAIATPEALQGVAPGTRMLPSPDPISPPKLVERLPEYRRAAGSPPAPAPSPNLSAPKPASSAPTRPEWASDPPPGLKPPGKGYHWNEGAQRFQKEKGGTFGKFKFDTPKKDNAKPATNGKGDKARTPGEEGEFKRGGLVSRALEVARKYARGGRVLVGPVVGATGGRTDALPVDVPAGAYVIPADCVSALGEGNSAAGFEKLTKSFGKPGRRDHAAGGSVPIKISDGEFVVTPEQVAKLGNGDMEQGHKVLDALVKRVRAEHIKTLSNLPPPATD